MINYILPCWSGARRMPDPRYIDRTFYLREHLDNLRKYKHNLGQITIVIPDNPDEPKEYTDFVSTIEPRIQETPVVVMRRPNIGLSYGSLSDAYGKYRTAFSHYLFQEDDVVYTQDNFDDKWMRMLNEYPDCGFMCGVAVDMFARHAGMGCGIMKAEALEKVWQKDGRLPYAISSGYGENEQQGQVGLSQAIINAGYTIEDMGKYYRGGFRRLDMSNDWFYAENLEIMVCPV